jgi:uncharacterized protein DUF4255
MADFHAIGGVTTTLQRLLADRMELPDLPTATLFTTGLPPFSARDVDPQPEDPRVNLFLYRVTENGYLQNQQIPGRGDSSGYGHPPLSLNLHYLLTTYGNTEDAAEAGVFYDGIAQELLGSAMRVLHDVPIISEKVTTLRAPTGRRILDQSLWDQYEQVKLSLEPLTLEDITKVWTALSLRYRLSAAYMVNVVQIESRRRPRFPRPVGQPLSPTIPPLPSDPPSPGPMVYVPTIQTPTITDLRVRRGGAGDEQPFPYANVGDVLVLRGTSLAGPVTRVAFDDVIVPAAVADGDRVEVGLPDAIPGVEPLQPGVHVVRVIVSDPQVPGSVFASNDVAFMLVPYVDPTLLVYAAGPRRLTIQGSRLIGPRSGGETIIGRSVVARASYSPAPPAPTPTPKQFVVPIPDTLPAAGVQAVIGNPLGATVSLGGPPDLTVTIGGVQKTFPVTSSAPLAPEELALLLQGQLRAAGAVAPADARFAGARVEVWRAPGAPARLIVLPGGLTDAIAVAGGAMAQLLGLDAPQAQGATTAAVSGELGSPPPLSSATPRLRVAMGGLGAVTVTIARPTALATLAADLQAQINAASAAPAHTGAVVATFGAQLLVVPGAAGAVTFTAAPGDATTVAELQLHARFAVRVRVNGAESIDRPGASAFVELPR